LGLILIGPPNLYFSFALFVTSAGNKKDKVGLSLIWHAFIWVIWKARNDGVFSNNVVTVDESVNQIIVWAVVYCEMLQRVRFCCMNGIGVRLTACSGSGVAVVLLGFDSVYVFVSYYFLSCCCCFFFLLDFNKENLFI
jgi:hypothetical protein